MRLHAINCPDCDTEMTLNFYRWISKGMELWQCPNCGNEIEADDYDDGELMDMGAALESE